jgi:aryl-alcohol dehydrogenase-like predicted oxidoreductase
MTFGTEWGWGADKQTSQNIFNTYVDRGGNFIDTANRYTNGTSEEFVGEFLVRQGKILYVAVSDAPAWKIAEANTLAKLRGWTPFIAAQVHYNLVERTSEHEIIPMACELGLAVIP